MSYQSDIIYTIASQGEVHQGRPSDSEGQEGEERWCFIDGKGLFHAKKYAGEWRFMFYTNEVIAEGEQSSTVVTTTVEEIQSDVGIFNELTVYDNSSLMGVTNISGASVSVSGSSSLLDFPRGSSLQITGDPGNLDTIQDIRTTAGPTFNKLSITTGVNASGSTYSTISNSQWGYLGNMDQDVTTDSAVQHATLTLTDSSKNWSIDPENSGHLRITTPDTEDAAIIIGSSSGFDDHTLRNHGYESGLFTGQGWAFYEDNNRHKLEVDDLSVRGTLSVFELIIQQVRATNGSVFVSSAAKIETDGSNISVSGAYYTLTFQSDDDSNKPHPFADNDLILARRVDISGSTNDIVSEVRFLVTDASAGNHNQCQVSGTAVGITLPTQQPTAVINGFDFVRVGNTTDANRRGGIYLTSDDTMAPFLDIFDGVSSWQEWDGITSIFGLGDNSFDLATVGSYTDDPELIAGSSWYAHTTGSTTEVEIKVDGGIQNNKYCLLLNGSSGSSAVAYVYQDITFPYISSGSYEVLLEWYGKKTLADSNHPRIAIKESFPGGDSQKYFQANGTINTGQSFWVDWGSITSPPSSQDNTNTVWHKYQWKLTVPDSLFDSTANKTMKLIFTTKPNTAYANAWIDDVNIAIEGKVKVRIGKLEGVGRAGYGLMAENVYLKGRIEANEGYIGNEFAGWRIESTGLINEADASYISAGQGANVGYENPGTYLDGTGKLFLGDADSYLKFDGDGTLTLAGQMIAGLIKSDDENTIFDLDNSVLKIEIAGDSTDLIKIGDNIGSSEDNKIILGSWQDQANSNALEGKGILVKHTNAVDYTTINISGIHRRNYPYPITVYQGFHWGGPTAFGVSDNAAYPSRYHDDYMWDSVFHGTRTVYDANTFKYNNGSDTSSGNVGFETYGANVGYFLTASAYGNYPDTIPSGRKLIIQVSASPLYILANGVYNEDDAYQLVTLSGKYGGPRPGKYSTNFVADNMEDYVSPSVSYTLFHNSSSFYDGFTGNHTWHSGNSTPYSQSNVGRVDVIDAGTIGTAILLDSFAHHIVNNQTIFVGEIPSGTSVENLYFFNAVATGSLEGGANYWIGNHITILETGDRLVDE